MSVQYATQHLEAAQLALKEERLPEAIRQISEALKLIFESGDLSEVAVLPYDTIPQDLLGLVDMIESSV